jgi:hypothetical protein
MPAGDLLLPDLDSLRIALGVDTLLESPRQVYPGNYEDYLWRKENHGDAASKPEPAPKVETVGDGQE